jgi:3-methyladenine DNA glycosylase/8-oxoguanine DNA glycosylase
MPPVSIIREWPLGRPLDLGLTLGIHRHGWADPTIASVGGRIARASRTPSGHATVALAVHGGRLRGEAWGPGASEALDAVPALVGLDDDAPPLPRGGHRLIGELARRMPGLRIGRTGNVFEALLPAILEQKVTGTEAFNAYRGLILAFGEVAPGPFGLRVAPAAGTVARLPYYAFHPLGVERRRADTLRYAASRAARLEEVVDLPLAQAYQRLTALPGVGPWTAGEVALRALGDPDAVSIGDYHLPNLVAWALAGEPRADDARMLELLEPWRGQRARVIRLLEASGIRAPRFGPRMAPRSIARI